MVLKEYSFVYATSNIRDGNMDFRFGEREEAVENRRRFLTKHDARLEDCAVMQVEYGERIVVVEEKFRGKGAFDGSAVPAEAFITREKNLVLFLLTADCLPIAYYDPVRHIAALAHLGWQPSTKRLASKVVKALKNNFSSNPNDLKIFIGPGIHKESYRFANPTQKNIPEWSPYLHDLPSGETEIDLVGYNVEELKRAGVVEANIAVSPVDTAASSEHFSHYRSVRTEEPEGRFATVLGMR
ncbi:hypothetical protein A3D66_01445 [Candidatus Kaiserbacteria bacterium RIFCSPHIGHO2_02_FULL_50_9]|uniref:Purine nucleoside phosphorylase n=1 Tax=Candidatus Kaiserbacteria bacterium RIFCSPLOWO2_01_FULL_51_21 TaxID=1798508 RepID=A0A1F6ED37_9BACT|nr:MAG: hypothetical protein A2761_02000 [Candidatus Kaiserbacteria bacterium RIFCSPHIGHO2_01_FULL_51_33]OGG63713.1 MAG: hypothetical protein A3D66_01445 [Candidatus Kaiserbacteria bacterium RIFCSPHIGHO2_02_FULL_50_9]OGG71517.1 MAG: hypothetical protein A3A35_02165 [Candidatus Kaiserbacteria bacterium RIFCSPLOWO2_01_FULL_51_21]